METLWNISWVVDNNGNKTNTCKYKNWHTPLGSWDKDSGRPSYVNQVTNDKLKFTEEEYQAVYAAATAALNVNKQCDDALITQADLQLVKDSEVGITMLGGNTCWHSTLGYYYYTGEVPTRENLHIIMLFPNTQDGHWTAGAGANNNYNGNIGVQRGDVVQLKYYPNIAQGDMGTVTDIFPAGTKLGFILKANGWGMQPTVDGKKYYVEGPGVTYGNRIYNVWGASTDGLSYCKAGGTGSNWAHLNPNGESRTAKFQCTTPNNHTYAIVSFEDACNDKNYSDVIFSLKPMDAFQKLPDPEDKVVETKGVYCFEDLWPSKGDYDLNDCVVGFKHAKKFEKKFDETEFKVIKETFSLTTYQNFVTLKSGLALTLNTQATPTSVVMKKVKGGVESEVNFTKDGDEYLLTEDITGELGTEYVLELNYENGITDQQTASVKPFIFRNQDNGKRWEVHIVGEAPTSKMDTSLFGTEDDLSDSSQGKYFVREGNYPFAFYLNNATVSDIARILDRANESKSIDQLFSGYMNWVNTGGNADSKWYKD